MIARRKVLVTFAFGIVWQLLAAAGQPQPKVPRVGILVAEARSGRLFVDAFADGLRELGYVDGRNVILEWRYSEGNSERLPDLARELVQLGVDVIHAAGPDAIRAARQATTTIPIVGIGGADPVAVGWAASLARPAGNITGLTGSHPEIAGKALGLLKEVVPGLTRAAALYDPAGIPPGSPYFQNMQDAARQLGLQVQTLGVSGPRDFDQAFTAAARGRAQALHLIESATLFDHRARLAQRAVRARLPAIAVLKQSAEAGFLMAYGPDVADLHRRAAIYVDKILRGAKAGDLPFERPTKFKLVINLKTAKALGLTIPRSLLLRADQVIE